MKKLICLVTTIAVLVGVLVCFPIVSTAAATGDISIQVNGNTIATDVKPIIKDGRTLIPVRFVSEALGAKVEWDKVYKKVTILKGSDNIQIKVNVKDVVVNNVKKTLDVPSLILKGRTFVPLRFISECLGAKVYWDSGNSIVHVSTGNYSPKLYFNLVEGKNPPKGFIQPKFYAEINPDPVNKPSYYYDVTFENLKEFKQANYSFKVEYVNYPQLNVTQEFDNSEPEHWDFWRDTTKTRTSTIAALVRVGYTTPEFAKNLKIKPSMKIEMRITLKNNNYKQVYTRIITIPDLGW